MLNETRLEGMSLLAAEEAICALIDTQTILQLLVKKNIVTREEVASTRAIVESQPKYKEVLQAIDGCMDKVDELVKFEELVQKSLQPDGNKKLTDEEREYLKSKISPCITN